MSASIEIRRATVADHEQLRPLFDDLDRLHREGVPWLFRAPDSDPRPPDYLQALISEPGVVVFVALALPVGVDAVTQADADTDAAPQCVGLAVAMLRETPEFPVFVPQRFAVVDSMAVRADHRRQGIGSQLFAACEAWATRQGATRLELGVYEFNQSARAFYEGLGFETVVRKMYRPVAG